MKKNLLAGLLLLWACSVYGQKRIVDPVRSDFSYVAKFDRVEITGKRTVAEVTLRYLPNYWIRYDSLTTYLQDCGSDRRYRLLAAEGFELNKEVYMPESGEMKARFIFDPVDADVHCVDFIDPSWKKSHNTYGIFLERSEKPSVLPDWASGNWLTTDGSNRWVCGFLPQTAVWRNDFWDYGTVTRKGKTLWVQLKNGDRDTTLCLKEGRDGALLLGSDGRTFATLGRDLVRRTTPAAEWKYDPEKYRNELYRPGTAVIRGVLEGYTPQFDFTSGTLMSYDPITGRDCAALIEVLPDGRFSAEIETEHPKTLVMSLGPGTIRNLYVEPGDTLMCRFVMSDLQNPQCRSGMKDWSRSRFMGRAAEYNMYRMIADRIVPAQDSVYGRTQECVGRGAADEYKAWIAERFRRTEDSLSALAARYEISGRTRDLLYAEHSQRAFCNLLDYASANQNSKIINGRLRDDGVYEAERNPDYRPLPASFYDFVTMERVDDPLMITTSDANSVISRLVVSSPVMNIGRIADAFSAFSGLFGPGLIAHIAGKVREGCPDLTPGQRAELDSLPFKSRGESVSIRDTMISRRFGACLKEFNAQRAKEQARLDTLREKYMYANAFDTLRRYGLDRCLAYDYALTGYFYSLVSQQQQNENFRLDLFAEMTRLLPYVGTPYLTGRIVRAYEEASSVVIRPVEKDEPRTKADDYFDELIAPYRGYVLYIDFWGTGCAPCRQGMVEARQTVEELKDSKIKFLYITSEGISPLAAYDRFLSERRIQGERLRLSDDQWNLLCTKFDIYGIPHCVVVDKQGRVVDNNRWSRSGPALCKSKLLELEKQ